MPRGAVGLRSLRTRFRPAPVMRLRAEESQCPRRVVTRPANPASSFDTIWSSRSTWQKSGNQLEAARAAFGDLKQFGKKIESYSRQGSFQVGVAKVGQEAADKNYAIRRVSPGEALALHGDFYSHHNRVVQAQPVLEEVVKTEPSYAQADLDKVALRLNQRPRKTLGFETPASRLRASVAPTH